MPENTPPSMAQVDRLIDTIAALQEELEITRLAVVRSSKRSFAAMVLAVASIGLFVVSLLTVISNRDAIHASNEIRDEARIVACVQENVRTATLHAKLPETIVALAPPGTALTPDQQARVDAYAKSVALGFPFRDCSPEGIAEYHRNLPVDPATGE